MTTTLPLHQTSGLWNAVYARYYGSELFTIKVESEPDWSQNGALPTLNDEPIRLIDVISDQSRLVEWEWPAW